MSIFTQRMNLATQPAMYQMAERVWLNGEIPLLAIFDPVDESTSRTPGGKKSDINTSIFVKRNDVIQHGIKKGDKISIQHGEGGLVRTRVQVVNDDGTDLVTLTCGSLSTGVAPG